MKVLRKVKGWQIYKKIGKSYIQNQRQEKK